jgi:outer membrane protein assembly factor BamB
VPRYLTRLAIVAWLTLLTAAPIDAQEWTRFRGPNGTGIGQAEFPVSWTADDYNWQTKLPGIGHSCPVVWDRTVYLMSADQETASQYVLAIDQRDGTITWQREFSIDSYHIHARNSFASVTPTVDADHVYVAWATPSQTVATALDHQGTRFGSGRSGNSAANTGSAPRPSCARIW